jgi:ribonuclease R
MSQEAGDSSPAESGGMRERLLAHLRDPKFEPQNKSELARDLEIDSTDRKVLREIIRDLKAEGLVMRLKKGRYQLREATGDVLTGTIRRQRNGNMFFLPDGHDAENKGTLRQLGMEPESRVYIPEKYAHTSLHGDRVAVRVFESGIPKWWKHVKRKRALIREMAESEERKLEGRVLKILKRRNQRIVGTFYRQGKFAYVKPDDRLLPETIDIPGNDHTETKHGSKVIVAVEEWQSRRENPRGRIVRSLGTADAPGVDILAIIHRYQLPLEFPPEVIEEADGIDEAISAGEIEKREDWRGRLVITIDPFDARDFDDAIAVRRLAEGSWELAVHIADVSHYVPAGGALDREAVDRGNSVYLVDRVLPMLPEKLSNGICSLKPDVDRLTRAAIMKFDEKGNLTAARFASAVIRSKCRLTYEAAYARMKEKAPGDDDKVTLLLQEAWLLASTLREKRFKEGALDLDFPEVRPVLDGKGNPLRLVRIEYDESHQLIEEFMLAANEAVAEKTRHEGVPALYRVHEEPDPEKLSEFRALVHSLDIDVGDLSVTQELRKLMRTIHGKPEEYSVKLGLLKSLKRAAYNADPLGHYGLAKANYTHFTSPIRRYADLVTHRVLWNLLHPEEPDERMSTPKYAGMQEIAEHVSTTERTAADAELETRRLKELEYLASLVASGEETTFAGLILEVRKMGLFIELTDYFIRGLIKPEDLRPCDYYYFEPAQQRFRGERTREVYKTGDRVTVAVDLVDLDRKLVDFRVVPADS